MFANAESYERFMGRWSRLLAPLLVEFSGAGDGGHGLDAGSGTGALSESWARMRRRVRITGVDPSKEYIEYARSKNSNAGRVTYEVGDAQQLRFSDGGFDASLSLLVFNFIPDPKQALSEIRRVTKRGGIVCAAVWDYGGEMRMLRVFWDAAVAVDPAAEKRDERHMPLCRAGELAELWKQGGLEQVEERPLDFQMDFRSFPDYWEPFLLGQGPAGAYASSLDPARREALRAEVNRRLPATAGGSAFSLPARAWAVRGIVPQRG